MQLIGIEAACVALAKAILTPTTGPVRCPRCERGLEDGDFARDVRRPSGRYPICLDCKGIARIRWWAAIPEVKKAEEKARQRAWHEAHRERRRQQKRRAKHNAAVSTAIERGRPALANLIAGLTVSGRRSRHSASASRRSAPGRSAATTTTEATRAAEGAPFTSKGTVRGPQPETMCA